MGGIDADNIQKRHLILVGLISTIYDKDLGIGIEVGDRKEVCKEESGYSIIWAKLNTAPEAFLVEFVNQSLNRILAF